MQPSMRLRVAAGVPPPMVPKSGAVAAKVLLPTLAWLGAAGIVGLYVSKQLHQRSTSFDDIFAQQNTPEVEEARKKDLLVETYGDPRNSLLNILGWTK
ncbi:hypothetical protein F5Y08DRAFT_335465 [Xylaria arbuscula]|uniref:Uncharacterized protein n=1 Tax=Xylaria arbuscula TaxID=114810 RepID=A0A9W8N871_9PEZI|nr:hypothetical protein F5Y08DRAFT_335465 [Xylaria arbuscula]KAJ3562807.1 hypothetical protein NPX13_g8424 [Xylaria arbuscula]